MFQYVILQLEDAKQAIYEKDSCRIYLLQAYQEISVLRLQNSELNSALILKKFLDLEKEIFTSFDNYNSNQYSHLKESIQDFITFLSNID